ncbi:MAG: hypothetical protein QOF73_3973, partial [Thermomicrobiales bacterium]|nr:hypothetical protein [Thermomicrobiales bacterium]
MVVGKGLPIAFDAALARRSADDAGDHADSRVPAI